eukprot:scaffold94045_cov37-Tisochrysis_lutea.AAC.1
MVGWEWCGGGVGVGGVCERWGEGAVQCSGTRRSPTPPTSKVMSLDSEAFTLSRVAYSVRVCLRFTVARSHRAGLWPLDSPLRSPDSALSMPATIKPFSSNSLTAHAAVYPLLSSQAAKTSYTPIPAALPPPRH